MKTLGNNFKRLIALFLTLAMTMSLLCIVSYADATVPTEVNSKTMISAEKAMEFRFNSTDENSNSYVSFNSYSVSQVTTQGLFYKLDLSEWANRQSDFQSVTFSLNVRTLVADAPINIYGIDYTQDLKTSMDSSSDVLTSGVGPKILGSADPTTYTLWKTTFNNATTPVGTVTPTAIGLNSIDITNYVIENMDIGNYEILLLTKGALATGNAVFAQVNTGYYLQATATYVSTIEADAIAAVNNADAETIASVINRYDHVFDFDSKVISNPDDYAGILSGVPYADKASIKSALTTLVSTKLNATTKAIVKSIQLQDLAITPDNFSINFASATRMGFMLGDISEFIAVKDTVKKVYLNVVTRKVTGVGAVPFNNPFILRGYDTPVDTTVAADFVTLRDTVSNHNATVASLDFLTTADNPVSIDITDYALSRLNSDGKLNLMFKPLLSVSSTGQIYGNYATSAEALKPKITVITEIPTATPDYDYEVTEIDAYNELTYEDDQNTIGQGQFHLNSVTVHKNTAYAGGTPAVIVATYTGGVLNSVKIASPTEAEKLVTASVGQDVEILFNASLQPRLPDYAKAFVWGSVTNLLPISSPLTLNKADTPTYDQGVLVQ